MAKVIKDREDFVNENYYETSSTMVPGAGVGAGLFNGASGVTEKDVTQMGANGISNDPDYRPPSQNTHAVASHPHIGDIVECTDKECKGYKTTGKVFAIYDGKADYIVANATENYAIGEVVAAPLSCLKVLKIHQMNKLS